MQTNIVEGYRLSPQQKRLCLLQQAEPGAPYRALCAVRVGGAPDHVSLRAALEDVVGRHESLRTTFQRLPGMSLPVQVINAGGVRWDAPRDLSGLSAPEQRDEVDRLFADALREGFDLESGPPLRATLATLSASEAVLILSLPSLCADRAGLRNLLSELARCYAARVGGGRIEDEPVQYADVTEYLIDLLESEETREGRRYWRGFNAEDYAQPRLPFEVQTPEGAGFAPEQFVRPVDPALLPRLDALARESQTDASVVLLACWQVLLSRLTGQSEMLVGVAFDGRRLEDLEGLVGPLERFLPSASRLDGGLSFRELVGRLDQTTSALNEWQDYFNWDQVPALQGGGAGFGFFPVCFESDEIPAVTPAGGVTFSVLRRYCCTERFKLKLSCVRRGDSLATEFHYDAKVFRAADVECLAEQFHALLASAVAGPGTAVGRLGFLSDRVRRRLLDDFNSTHDEASGVRLVQRQIEEQAERAPHETAVAFGPRRLSFAELNGRANRLAHHLRGLGVGPDVMVGVCMERGLELMVALLGVLKAGGAYVPLDPTYPKQRLSFILEQTRAPVLLTQERLADSLPEHGARVIYLEAGRDPLAAESEDNPRGGAEADNLAYVIYTSGSTGRPKGVMVTHGGLANYLSWAAAAYRVAEGRGAPVHSTVGFDLTVTSLLTPLTAGRQVTLLGNEEGPEGLADALRAHKGFSLVKLTPSHLHVLGQLLSGAEAAGVTNALVVGGEALFAETLSFWRAHAPGTRIVNEYGPTEATVGCCVYEVGERDGVRGAVPIGRPIANTRLYVLDAEMEPVPVKVPGEIYIGGAGLARGYLGRPDLTAERFIPDPFSTEPGARLYRTGDLGRFGADAQLEYLGRADQQIKLRGYRIELGEIEALMSEHPRVREAAAALREDAGEKRLVGYLVADGPDESVVPQVSEYLKERLPEYMVPARFVLLDRLPLTTNGKVDRASLPSADEAAPAYSREYVAPRPGVEETLAGLWAKALGLERVGAHDDFFELGGDSIISIQIANRANALGVRFAPRQVFQHRTIERLAAAVESSAPARAAHESVTGEVPLTPIQHWFFEQELPEAHHWNQALMLETRERLDAAALEEALRHVALRHDALRLRFVREGGAWRQLVGETPPAGLLTVADLSAAPAGGREEALGALSTELQSGLSLSEGRLMRAALVRLGAQRPDLLLVVIHHLAVDIVSWGILLEGIEQAYRQVVGGGPVSLPEKTTPYGVWAERLRQYAQTPKLLREAPYWLDESRRGAGAVPLDFPSGDNTEDSARSVRVSLGAAETDALLKEVPRVYRTMINDVLLTALARALSSWAGPRPVLIDLENHGREELFEDLDLSRTVGWFTCIFPLALDAGRMKGPGEALKAVKEQVRGVPKGGIGYGLLRYLCADAEVSRRLKALPRAGVCFNYVGRSGQAGSGSTLFGAALEAPSPSHSPRGTRAYVIEINGGVGPGGQLQMAFTYSENLHRRQTVERLAEGFVSELMAIIEHCASAGEAGRASAAPLVGDMNQHDLDELIAGLDDFGDEG